MRTGLIDEGHRPVLGDETVSPMAIDPLAWHLLLILIPTGAGYLLTNAIQDATGLGVPSFLRRLPGSDFIPFPVKRN